MRASIPTWLSLYDWAKIMRYSMSNFAGLNNFPCQVGRNCGNVWFQYDEQSDFISRESLAIAIRDAEDMLANYVGYNLLPDWNDETLDPPQFYKPEYKSSVTIKGKPKSIQVGKRYVRQAGIRAKTLLEEDAAVTFIDKDGDGFSETAQVTVTTTYDFNQIRLYYPGEEGDDGWEIRPIKIKSDGTAEFPVWLIVKPEYTEVNCPEPPNPDDPDIFLEEVDVYRVYNDTSVQAVLVYEPGGYYCADDNCDLTSVDSCAYVDNEKLGYITYNPNLYEEPDKVELHYYSGWTADRGVARPLVELDPYWKTPIAYLAASLLLGTCVDCCEGNESSAVAKWATDLSERSDDKPSYAVTQFILENPFGVTTKGAYYAWQKARAKRIR